MRATISKEMLRDRLRAAVYAEFDCMYEEATGNRPAPNQSVIDMLERNQRKGDRCR